MVCYQINTMSVELKMGNKDLILETLKSMNIIYREIGSTIQIGSYMNLYLDEGRAEFPDFKQDVMNQIKREYARKAIEMVAKKRRWAIRQNGRKMNITKY